MKYCMECGTKLRLKELEGEGIIPYCEHCHAYRFPVFNTACSMVVLNKTEDKILLIKQYGRTNYILVAGYVNKGEDAEDTVVREIKEEIGLDVVRLGFNKSEYYEKSNTLMLNFYAVVDDESLSGMTDEVDHAKWFSFEDAKKNIHREGNPSLAEKFLLAFLEKREQGLL